MSCLGVDCGFGLLFRSGGLILQYVDCSFFSEAQLSFALEGGY